MDCEEEVIGVLSEGQSISLSFPSSSAWGQMDRARPVAATCVQTGVILPLVTWAAEQSRAGQDQALLIITENTVKQL